MEVKIICRNLIFMDLISPFGISGDFIGYINMHDPHLFTFGNTKLQYMSSTTKLQLKKINEQNHNRALGANEGVPNEITLGNMKEYYRIQILNFFRTSNLW